MARRIGRLKALAVSRAKQPGMYADGGGLYLQVTSASSPVLGLSLRPGWQDPLHGSGLPQRCKPLRSPRAGRRSPPAGFGGD